MTYIYIGVIALVLAAIADLLMFLSVNYDWKYKKVFCALAFLFLIVFVACFFAYDQYTGTL